MAILSPSRDRIRGLTSALRQDTWRCSNNETLWTHLGLRATTMEPITRTLDEELLNDGMALRHHLASCFRALRKRAAQRAEKMVTLHAATSIMEDAMLRHYFSKWLATAYFRSTLARPLHDFVCRQRASSTTAARLRQWSASTRADPRTILDGWPDGE